ncbi:MAG: ATP synthase subunit C [Firmicutes bacterium]|nr:ATP synthase subunit C [Bacillota bacterium]
MLNGFEFLLPLVLLALTFLPFIKIFRKKVQKESMIRRLVTHISLFAALLVFTFFFTVGNQVVLAAEPVVEGTITGTLAQGLGFLSAALATGLSAVGAGIAVAAAAPAAIGAFSENEKNFGKSLIFVALGEGVAIYGLLISILIINKI